MRAIIDCDTLQLELTNFCTMGCSNCTRFCSHIQKPFFMDFEYFKKAVDSLEGFPKMVGFQGGECLYHPDFEKMCEYARSKFPKDQLGLWTTFPAGKEKYREVICETFEHIFLNDHTRDDIYHHPFLVSNEECFREPEEMWLAVEHCRFGNGWSPSINPKGGFFCEMMGSFAMLFDDGDGAWPIEKNWWRRMPWEIADQVKKFCPKCGGAAVLPLRVSTDKVDDISPNNLERLKKIHSKRIEDGKYVVSDCKMVEPKKLPAMAAYKDLNYRNSIAARYGVFLTINDRGFWTPHLKKHKGERDFFEPRAIHDIFKERWAKTA